jgi:hypothetical protein
MKMQSINFGCIFLLNTIIMEIFGRLIFGDAIEQFCNLSKEAKTEWILKYTDQRNEVIIEDFVSNPINKKDCGCGCGGNKQNNVNISETIPNEIAVSNENSGSKGVSKRGTNKGRNNPKKS